MPTKNKGANRMRMIDKTIESFPVSKTNKISLGEIHGRMFELFGKHTMMRSALGHWVRRSEKIRYQRDGLHGTFYYYRVR